LQERQDAGFATAKLFEGQKITVNGVTVDEYTAELSTQILYRALKDPTDQDKGIASDISEFRKRITEAEIAYFADEYRAFEKECSPSPENLSSDEFDRIVNDVKKNAIQAISNLSSIRTLKRLCLFLASPPQS
jgi:hypothetical protein